MKSDASLGGNMSIQTAQMVQDSTHISTGSNLFLILFTIFLLIVLVIEVYWTTRNKVLYNTLRSKKEALALREENLSNAEEELQQDKIMWEEGLARLVMENETLKEIIDKIGKAKIDNAYDVATVSEYLGVFRDLNTADEHLTKIILYGENRLELQLHDLLHLKPDIES